MLRRSSSLAILSVVKDSLFARNVSSAKDLIPFLFNIKKQMLLFAQHDIIGFFSILLTHSECFT